MNISSVFAIPLRTRFRGITVREGVLLRGENGWGEWSPFPEYPPAVAEPWLRCAEEAAAGDWPEPLREWVPVNVTVPAVGAERAHEIVTAGGCTTAKVKVAEPGQTLGDDQARVEAVRDALGPGGRIRVDVNGGWDVEEAGWSTSSSRARASRSSLRFARPSTYRSRRTSRSAGPRTPTGCATSPRPTSPC
jgi:O-succinylbenzoate synthase